MNVSAPGDVWSVAIMDLKSYHPGGTNLRPSLVVQVQSQSREEAWLHTQGHYGTRWQLCRSQSQRQGAFKDMISHPQDSPWICLDGPEDSCSGGKAGLRWIPRSHTGCLEKESNHSIKCPYPPPRVKSAESMK